MYKYLFGLTMLSICLVGCNKESDPFTIGKHHVGLLTDSTQIHELHHIFQNDSIVNYTGTNEFTINIHDIEIFEKGGNKLLILTPRERMDSTAWIKNVRILDPRYKTDKNISIRSTFKDLSEAYTITKIDHLINAIQVSVKDINATFTIDKTELPASLRFDPNLKIEAIHIPDDAKIKYFFINWNK